MSGISRYTRQLDKKYIRIRKVTPLTLTLTPTLSHSEGTECATN